MFIYIFIYYYYNNGTQSRRYKIYNVFFTFFYFLFMLFLHFWLAPSLGVRPCHSSSSFRGSSTFLVAIFLFLSFFFSFFLFLFFLVRHLRSFLLDRRIVSIQSSIFPFVFSNPSTGRSTLDLDHRKFHIIYGFTLRGLRLLRIYFSCLLCYR